MIVTVCWSKVRNNDKWDVVVVVHVHLFIVFLPLIAHPCGTIALLMNVVAHSSLIAHLINVLTHMLNCVVIIIPIVHPYK